MADLTDLARAVRDSAEPALPPAFETLVRRARTRRRRRVLGAGAVAALALAGTAAVLLPHDDGSTLPPVVQRPTPTPSLPTGPVTPQERLKALTPDQVVARGTLSGYGSTGGGEVLTVWEVCVQHHLHCRFAWRLTGPAGAAVDGAAGSGDSPPAVYAGGGAFVVKAWNRPGMVVTPSGEVVPLHAGPPRVPDQRFTVVRSGPVGLALVDTRTGESHRLEQPPGTEGFVQGVLAPREVLWALPMDSAARSVDVQWGRGDGRWSRHVVAEGGVAAHLPGALAVADRRVAVLASFDGATVLPVGTLAVTTDAGATWRHLGKADVPFRYVDSMAATAGGVLFVAEPDGTLWHSTDGSWSTFARVPGLGPVGQLTPAGEQVLARVSSTSDAPSASLLLIDDDGSAHPVSLR